MGNHRLRHATIRGSRDGCGRGSRNRGPADRRSKIVYAGQKYLLFGKSRLGESQFVAWVGATCAFLPISESARGEFDLGAQRIHLIAQRIPTRLGLGAVSQRVRAVGEVPEVCQTCARKGAAAVTREMTLAGGSAGPREKSPFWNVTYCSGPPAGLTYGGSGGERRLSRKPACATASRHFELRDGFLGLQPLELAAVGYHGGSGVRKERY